MTVVRWLPESLVDLRRLYDFIAEHSPAAASKAIDTLLGAVETLEEFPERGRTWEPDHDFRELYVRFGARGYVIRYRLFENQIIIIRVWHSLEKR